MGLLDAFEELLPVTDVGAGVFDAGAEDIAETMLPHELEGYDPVALFQISLGIVLLALPKLPEVQERVYFLFGLFVKLIELAVRVFFPRQEIFYFRRISLDKDVDGRPEVFRDVFGVIVFPLLLDSQLFVAKLFLIFKRSIQVEIFMGFDGLPSIRARNARLGTWSRQVAGIKRIQNQLLVDMQGHFQTADQRCLALPQFLHRILQDRRKSSIFFALCVKFLPFFHIFQIRNYYQVIKSNLYS